MKKAKILITSLLTIIGCSTIVVGSTYSLFTTSDETNIAITSGKVKLTAAINSNLEVYSPKSIDPSDYSIKDETNIASNGTFGNGGTAKIESDGTLTLDKMTPGDKATFKIKFTNKSNVNIKYKVSFTDVTSYSGTESYKLIDELVVKANNAEIASDDVVVDWTDVTPEVSISDLTISVELPTTTDDSYQNLSSSLKFTVEAVQGNAYTELNPLSVPYITFSSDQEFTLGTTVVGWENTEDHYLQSSTNGTDWTNWNGSNIDSSDEYKLYLRGKGFTTLASNPSNGKITIFTLNSNGLVDCSGDIMRLLDYENPKSVQMTNCCFMDLFCGFEKLKSCPTLSAKTLATYCYNSMFSGCTNITSAPALPAKELADHCYAWMFSGCSSLAQCPKLPATTLDSYCYGGMFQNCVAITEAPELNAKTLAGACYMDMFDGCTNLLAMPNLPATNLETSCYAGMFSGCKSLSTALTLPVTTLAEQCYSSMFSGCTSLVNAPTLPVNKLEYMCYNSMFSGCTSLVNAPALPATELANECYRDMFNGCTSLINAPALPATTLKDYCYYKMFYECCCLKISESNSIDKKIFTYPSDCTATDPCLDMFTYTDGTFNGSPVKGNTYFNEN